MADLDLQEMKMFAKWYATPDLAGNREFWRDCMSAYLDKSVTLPMYDEPAERETVLKLVRCPPGECGDCCRYEKVAISRKEYAALKAGSREPVNVSTDEAGNLFLNSSGGCQFLKNNICSVYALRPAVCGAFPVITPKEVVSIEGAPLRQIQIKLKCPAALEAVKSIFTNVCAKGKLMLLPDLSLIPAYENGKGVLGAI